jgi:PmbA protein
MFDVVDAALDRARAQGLDDVEVYAERSTSRRIKVYRQEVEQLTAAERRGVGVRVFRDGAVGHAYTSDVSGASLDEVVRRAADNAAVSDADEFAALPRPGGAPAAVDPYDERLAAATDAQRIDLALAVEAAALAADPRV